MLAYSSDKGYYCKSLEEIAFEADWSMPLDEPKQERPWWESIPHWKEEKGETFLSSLKTLHETITPLGMGIKAFRDIRDWWRSR